MTIDREEARGIVRLYVPADTYEIDRSVMRHACDEMRNVLIECLLDLAAYCEDDNWKVTAEVMFERVEVNENGK